MKKKLALSGIIGLIIGFVGGIYAMLKAIVKLELVTAAKEKIIDKIYYLLYGTHSYESIRPRPSYERKTYTPYYSYRYNGPIYNRKPYIISKTEFGNRPGYDVKTLCYYVEDDVLTKEIGEKDTEKIGSFEKELIIGYSWEIEAFFNDDSKDLLLVRNEQLRTDFEIFKSFGRFSDYVDLEEDKEESKDGNVL